MGHIESDKSNPAYSIGSCYINKARLELSESNEVGVKYEFLLEKIVVVEFYFTNKHKQKRKNKQTNKKKEKSKPSSY